MALSAAPTIDDVRARAYRVPTDRPEADGTYAWTATTIVVVEIDAAGVTGLGYTYSDASAATLATSLIAGVLRHRPLVDIPAAVDAMWRAVRNVGRAGIAATAISALDTALWDAKAKLAGVPLAMLLGRARERVPVYGSGGFTTYDDATLAAQLDGWRSDGVHACKVKIGTDDARDPSRVRLARAALGPDVDLFVDANGAYAPRTALAFADAAADCAIRWFRSRSAATTSTGCASCASTSARRSTSRRANTRTRPTTSGACSKAARSTCCKPMRRAAAASAVFWRPARWPRRTTSTCRPTARPRCTGTSVASRRGCVTSSGFTITCGSSE